MRAAGVGSTALAFTLRFQEAMFESDSVTEMRVWAPWGAHTRPPPALIWGGPGLAWGTRGRRSGLAE